MSRSRRRLPITAVTTASSEKRDKQRASRRIRRNVRQVLAANPDAVLPNRRELSNPWNFDKDGKAWRGWSDPTVLRK